MDIKITDVMLHIDEELDKDHRNSLESYMRGQDYYLSWLS